MVTVPKATGDVTQPPLTPGEITIHFEQWTSDLPAFYLVYVRPITGQTAIRWKHMAVNSFILGGRFNGIEIENRGILDADVRCIAFRLGSLVD